MKKATCLMAICLTSIFLTACGSSKSSYTADTAPSVDMAVTNEATADTGTWESDAYAEEDAVTESPEESVETGRKLIKTVNMSVETKQFEDLLKSIKSRCSELGGYIESQNVFNGSSYYGYNTTRNASLTLRVPADRLDEFLADVESQGNVTNRSDNVQDVTLSYVDMQSRKEALITEKERLMELLEQAESVEDLITIESRLSEVRYQIESMESQLRTFDNQIDYSTVYLDIQEVENLTQVEEESTGSRIVREFSENLRSALNGLKEFGIRIIVNLPYLIEWAIVITVIVVIIRKICNHKKKKKMAPESSVIKEEQDDK